MSAWSNVFGRLKIENKIQILVILFSTSMFVFGAVVYNIIEKAKVNGPIYLSIVQGKDLIADILPPPEFIVESYLVIFQMAHVDKKEDFLSLLSKFKELKSQYDDRHQFWIKDLQEGEIKKLLVETSSESAYRFYKIAFDEYIPALEQGQETLALSILENKLKEQYTIHKTIIDQIADLQNKTNLQIEQETASFLKRSMLILFAVLMLVCVLVSSFGWQIKKQISNQLQESWTSVLDTAQKLKDLSLELEENASSSFKESKNMTDIAMQSKSSVEELSKGIDNFENSVREISSNTVQTSSLSQEAVRIVQDTQSQVKRLGASSQEIGNVVKVITAVAEQTNLLALNATIEAARAGSVGKGFAVVANEVKELSKETARATDEIKQKIEAIQLLTNESIEAISKIFEIIQKVNEMQSLVALAVEKQSETTKQLTERVSSVAQNSIEIENSVVVVNGNIQKTSENSHLITQNIPKLSECVRQIVHGKNAT